jgi:hypothetical protein
MASRLPHAMAGYILWLAPEMDKLPELLHGTFDAARHRATSGGEHLRVPGALAHLWIGIDCALCYATEVGATSNSEADGIRSRCWDALRDVGLRHAQSVEGERPSRHFLSVLATLLAQGRAILFDRDMRPDGYNGSAALVGWQDPEFVYLMPDAAFNAVARFCKDAGEFFPARSERLFRDLNREALSSCAEGRNTATAILGGQKRRVVRIVREKAEELLGEALPGSLSVRTAGTGIEE